MPIEVQDIFKLEREKGSQELITPERLGSGLKITELRIKSEGAAREALKAAFKVIQLNDTNLKLRAGDVKSRLIKFFGKDNIKADEEDLNELARRIFNIITTCRINDQGLAIDRVISDTRALHQGIAGIYKQNEKKLGEQAEQFQGYIKSAASFLSRLKAEIDLTKLMADGLVRTDISHINPAAMDKLRKERGLDPKVCDLIVIGGGASGLATAYHANRQGVDTILFESGYIAQQFSDAGAPNVHEMRTNETQSSLVRDRIAPRASVAAAGMQHVTSRHNIPELAEQARHSKERVHQTKIGSIYASDEDRKDPDYPTTRATLFAYLQQLKSISEEQGVLISEETPVMSVTYDRESKLFTVKSDLGHEIRTRKLVIGQGLVGEDLEHARGIPELKELASRHPDRFIYLDDQMALQENAKLMHAALNADRPKKQLFINDALMGQGEILDYLHKLPAGSKMAVVGSGESAAKAVIELLRRRPDCEVAMYCKHKIEPYQIQFPLITKTDEPFERAIFDPEFAQLTLDLLHNHFGTPITSRTTLELFDAVHSGKLKIYEMGLAFGTESVQLKATSRGIEVLKHPECAELQANLEHQRKDWQAAGLIPAGRNYLTQNFPDITGPVIMATGYDRQRAKAEHLANQMHIKDDPLAISDKNMLSTQGNENLFLVGSSHLRTAHDGNLTGIGTRAFYTAQHIAESLKGAEPTAETLIKQFEHESRRQVFHHPDDPFVLQIENLYPAAVESALQASNQRKRGVYGNNQQATKEPGPAIKLFLQRRFDLVNRVETALVEKTYPAGKDKSLFSSN